VAAFLVLFGPVYPMPAVLVAQQGDRLRRGPVQVAVGHQHLLRHTRDRHGDVVVDGPLHDPLHLVGVLDVGAHPVGVRGHVRGQPDPAVLQPLSHELDQPAADDGAVVPVLEQRRQVDAVVVAAEHLDPLGDRLDHAELDRVVHELGEVPAR
jgi:hypothetical protein